MQSVRMVSKDICTCPNNSKRIKLSSSYICSNCGNLVDGNKSEYDTQVLQTTEEEQLRKIKTNTTETQQRKNEKKDKLDIHSAD